MKALSRTLWWWVWSEWDTVWEWVFVVGGIANEVWGQCAVVCVCVCVCVCVMDNIAHLCFPATQTWNTGGGKERSSFFVPLLRLTFSVTRPCDEVFLLSLSFCCSQSERHQLILPFFFLSLSSSHFKDVSVGRREYIMYITDKWKKQDKLNN